MTVDETEVAVFLSGFKSFNDYMTWWVVMSSVHKRKNRMTMFATPQKSIHFIKMNKYYTHLCDIK